MSANDTLNPEFIKPDFVYHSLSGNAMRESPSIGNDHGLLYCTQGERRGTTAIAGY